MIDKGWIKLHRKLLDNPIWNNSTVEQKVILLTLLMMANHDYKEWEWCGRKYEAKPGQFVTSVASIIDKSGKGISRQNVRTALERFKKYNFLTTESTKTGLLITIVNWSAYQDTKINTNQATNQDITNDQPTTNQGVTTNKNEKNDNKLYIDHFNKFWGVYPKKVAKSTAEKSFKKLKVDDELLIKILDSLEIHKQSKQWQDRQFIPNPSTWLNQKRWEDEVEEVSKDERVTITAEGTFKF